MKRKQQKLKIVILGTQASGKGTQTHILSITQNVPAVSMGNLLRDAAAQDTPHGRTIKDALSKGGFPPEDLVLEILKAWVDKHPDGWIVDGFPRTIQQAEKSAVFFRPDVVLFLEITDEEAKRRISYRRVCVKCHTGYNIITQPPKNSRGVCDVCGGELARRPDDTPELIVERLRQYHEMTAPLKEWYRKRKVLVEIDARQGMKEVAHEIEQRLKSVRSHSFRVRRWLAWCLVALAFVVVVLAVLVYTGSNLPDTYYY